MRAGAFLYPWDVNGDPAAPGRVAGLGVSQVALAAAHHSTRALTPRHPRHRVVTAEYAAVLYPPDEGRWAGRVPRPYRAGSWAPGDACGEAAEALAAAGLEVHTWVVLAHNSRLRAEHPGTCVVNAYGDRYPWASCIAQPAVRAFLTGPAAGAAVRPGGAAPSWSPAAGTASPVCTPTTRPPGWHSGTPPSTRCRSASAVSGRPSAAPSPPTGATDPAPERAPGRSVAAVPADRESGVRRCARCPVPRPLRAVPSGAPGGPVG